MEEGVMEESIYSNIYKILKCNIEKEGLEIGYSYKTFLYMSEKTPRELDLLDIAYEEEKEIFLELAYMGFFGRLPEEAAREKWSIRGKEVSLQTYKEEIVTRLLASGERKDKEVKVYHNIFRKKNHQNSNKPSRKKGKRQHIKDRVVSFYLKLPEPIKNLYRAIKRKWKRYK